MYQYDIFVSYKREPIEKRLVTPWLRDVLDRIEFWLRQELGGRQIRTFFDEDSIDVGTNWPNEIRDALVRARCLLAIWSPEYFQSAWCRSEWKSFLAREKRIADHDGGNCSLVFPIKLHDGLWFPREAQETQQLDLSAYAATTRAFWQSQRADELDQIIRKRLAPALAKVVAEAPDYEDDWPIETDTPLPAPAQVEMIRL
jgi:hypothetical protein